MTALIANAVVVRDVITGLSLLVVLVGIATVLFAWYGARTQADKAKQALLEHAKPPGCVEVTKVGEYLFTTIGAIPTVLYEEEQQVREDVAKALRAVADYRTLPSARVPRS